MDPGFATYHQDGGSGLQYAMNRYYDPARGRFTTADPYGGSASLANPLSWNKYSYVLGDPINHKDPLGLCADMIAGSTMGSNPSSTFNSTASKLGAAMAFPYSGLNIIGSVASIAGQAQGPNDSTAVAYASLTNTLANNTGKIDVVAYSGGASAFTAAYGLLTSAQRSQIGSILYVSPGAVGQLASIPGATSIIAGRGPEDGAAIALTAFPPGVPVKYTSCEHTDLACLLANAQTQMFKISANGACNNPGISTLVPSGGGGTVGQSPPQFPPSWTAPNPWSLIDWVYTIPLGGGGGTPDVTSTIRYDMDLC